MTTFASMRVDFSNFLGVYGRNVIWRVRSFTIDSVHGVPTAEGSPSDTSVSCFIIPPRVGYEEHVKEGRQFKSGDMFFFTPASNKVQVGDWVFDKDEDETGYTTVAGTDATQIVISGDLRHKFAANDYISIDDADNDGLYVLTGVSYASGPDETTLTVALDADPGVGDVVYKAATWKVLETQVLPNDTDSVFRRCVIERRSNN